MFQYYLEELGLQMVRNSCVTCLQMSVLIIHLVELIQRDYNEK
jgi:hypothetical protein